MRRFIERVTGYWLYKSRYLPIGADFRVDLERLDFTPRVIFDVGANVGQTYRRFRHDFPKARIYCFEPAAASYAELSRLLSHDSLAVAIRLAFGREAGEAVMHTHPEWNVLNTLRPELATSQDSELVPVSTIDEYGIEPIDLLKIDTEGFEIPVLEGAADALSRGVIRAVLAEVGFGRANQRNTYFGDVAELLSKSEHVFHGLYDVTHYADGKQGSFANALFLHRSVVSGVSTTWA